jgi:hypothetical protein
MVAGLHTCAIADRSMACMAVLIAALFAVGSLAFAQSNTQKPAQPTGTKILSHERIAELLRQPNGLAAAANLVGKFVIDGQGRLWSHTSLQNMAASSNLVVVGKITLRESRLSEDGDDIYTDYLIETERIVRGKSSGSISFTAHGGLVEFPNGTSAQVTTIEWQQLQIGQKYAVLLSQEQDGRYYPANVLEALFKLSTADGNVDAFAAHDGKRHTITDEVKGLPANSFLNRAS